MSISSFYCFTNLSVSGCLLVGGRGVDGSIGLEAVKKTHHTHNFFIPLNLSFLEAYLLHSCDLRRRVSAHRKVRNLQPSPLTFSPKIYSHVSRPIRVDLCVA